MALSCLPALTVQQIGKFVHADQRKLLAEHCCDTELELSPTGHVRLKGKVDDDTKLTTLVELLTPAWVVTDLKTDSQSVFLIVISGPGPHAEVALRLAATERHEV